MDTLEKIAYELVKHKLVPFIGAGVSFEHLHLDWDILCSEMNMETGINEKENLMAAQHYVDKFGKNNFVNFLKKHLLINDFNDIKGESALFLLSINSPHYYTTNQDNIFEKCLEKYCRKYQNVSTKETFQNMKQNLTTIFKFHGDLQYPETVVFTKSDYKVRMPKNNELPNYNPLDIMLIADTISRGCLFIGYSFRDPNVNEIFNHISTIFNGNPPKSYLIEYFPDVDFEIKLKKYNIECINCSDFFPDMNNAEAYSAVLSFLITKSFEYRDQNEIGELFSCDQYSIIPILTFYELNNFEKYINTTSDKINTIINKFRALSDRRNIPVDLSKSASEIIKKMLVSIDSKVSLLNFQEALHNINIPDINIASDIMIEYYCKLNDISECDAMENIRLFNIHMQHIHSNYNIFFATAALEKLSTDGKKTYNLLNCISYSIGSAGDIEELPPDIQEYIKFQFNKQYSYERNLRNPLNGPNLYFSKKLTYEDILNDLKNMMPKYFK